MAATGHLKIYTAGYSTLLVDFALQIPSFVVVNDTATLLGVPLSAAGLANGTASAARVFDLNGNLVIDQLTVGQTNANLIVTSINVTTGQPHTLVSGVIKHG